jgi:hypothetical protein
MHKSSEYGIWCSMKGRCLNPNAHKYNLYGGNGVKIHPEWIDSFDAFYRDVGPRPSPRHSLDRFPDKTGNYEPGNVRWATQKEQMRNTSVNRTLTHDGKTMCITEWAEHLGICVKTIQCRIDQYGWSVERALTAPVRVRKVNHITIDGRTQTLSRWCKERGVKLLTILARIRKGMDPVEAVLMPIKGRA